MYTCVNQYRDLYTKANQLMIFCIIGAIDGSDCKCDLRSMWCCIPLTILASGLLHNSDH